MNIFRFKIKYIGKYIKMIKNHRRPFRNILGLTLVYTKLSKFFTIKRSGYDIIFHPTAISLNYFNSKNSRTSDEKVLEKILTTDGTYIDIGANIGALALKAYSIVGKEGDVYAVEAHPTTFRYLESNFKLNKFDNVRLFNVGIGKEKGILRFSNTNSDDQNHVIDKGGIEIEIVSLDSISKELNEINLLKIDVEGFELMVVEGGISTLLKSKFVMIEFYDKNFERYGYDSNDLLNKLFSLGFKCYRIIENDKLEALIPGKDYYFQKVENVICENKGQSLLKFGFHL